MLAVNSDRLDVSRHIDDEDVSTPTDGPGFRHKGFCHAESIVAIW